LGSKDRGEGSFAHLDSWDAIACPKRETLRKSLLFGGVTDRQQFHHVMSSDC
jgi:hypothetical protein